MGEHPRRPAVTGSVRSRRSGAAALTDILARPVDAAARDLLGATVSAGGVTVRLTEVEAYGGIGVDAASHAFRGRTGRNAVMFGPAGVAYVYFVFGMHWCLNVVTGPAGVAAAVLLRAGEVVSGVPTARTRRATALGRDRELARGPARLAAALGLDGSATGTSLVDGTGPAVLRAPTAQPDPSLVRRGPRVGVAGAHDVPWRFWLADEPTVSPYRRHAPRQPRPRPSHP